MLLSFNFLILGTEFEHYHYENNQKCLIATASHLLEAGRRFPSTHPERRRRLLRLPRAAPVLLRRWRRRRRGGGGAAGRWRRQRGGALPQRAVEGPRRRRLPQRGEGHPQVSRSRHEHYYSSSFLAGNYLLTWEVWGVGFLVASIVNAEPV